MPMKVDKCRLIPVRSRKRILSMCEDARKKLFSDAPPPPQIKHDGGNNIMHDAHINTLEHLMFNIIDKINPILVKHPKLFNLSINIGSFLHKIQHNK